MKTLYLIDGYAQFFRAYHAIRTPMTSPVTKEPTNATFGFVDMLLRVIGNIKPDYLAVAIDVSGDKETFRSELYPAYKAHREAAPEDFHPQAQRCISLLREIGVPVLGVEGFEADDVLATIVHQLHETHPDIRIRIVSKDKDLQQLLDAGDGAHAPVEMHDVHTNEVMTAARLVEEKGVTPAQVIDMLALMGDNVDNVPGAAGVGPKTAAQLIHEFGTLEGVIAAANNGTHKLMTPKRRENILAVADQLPLSKVLVTLRADAPSVLDLDAATTNSFNLKKLAPLMRELGFKRHEDTLKAMLGKDAQAELEHDIERPEPKKAVRPDTGGLFDALDDGPHRSTDDRNYEVVTTKAQLDALVKDLTAAGRAKRIVALDTESTSYHAMRADLVGLSFAVSHGRAWYVPVRSPEPDKHLDTQTVLNALRPILESSDIHKTGHNLKFDMLILRRAGINLQGVQDDTLIASFVLDTARSSHSLDALALAELKHTCTPISDLIGSGAHQKGFDEVPIERAAPYAAEDADIALQLRDVLVPQVEKTGLGPLYHTLEMPLIQVLAELEYNGIRVDPDELDRQREAIVDDIERLRRDIQDAAPRTFNPDSPKQLATILFNKPDAAEPGLGLKPLKKTKTGHATDVEVLESLADDDSIESPLPRLIVEYRQLTKLVNTYLIALKEAINPETHRIHSSFHHTGAATGRLSSSDPNLQNIPIRTTIGRQIRKAFIADPGNQLIIADYSQIELRLLAHLAHDEALIAAFRAGEDIHRAVAAQIHNVPLEQVTSAQRSGAKAVNFGIVYGITAYGLARQLGISTAEADTIITDYKARYQGIDRFLQQCVAEAKEKGYVETMLGRRRPILGIESRNLAQRRAAERLAINSVVQGSAADLIKKAMVDLFAEVRWGSLRAKMLLQIHDELVFEAGEADVPAAIALIRVKMEKAMAVDVPIQVDVVAGSSWYEKA
ncbi:MAG: DNA polymerase I [Phycisphaerales bacterium]|nr:DNA polymerase I [Phycisphaerales bacterium]